MSRVSLRLRLTLAFGLAMAIVLGAVGALLYLRLGDSLTEQLDESLEARADVLAAGDLTSRLPSTDDESFAQVLGSDGSLLGASASVTEPLISQEETDRARTGAFFLGRDDARLLVTPVDGRALVLVVGASMEDRDEALDGLLAQLFAVGPLALLLASLAGYFLAAAALRPVEAMRRRAADVSTDRPGQRLPLPAARDEIRRLGETLNAMLARLEAGLERERRFVADASHELRTPLALLKTELELAFGRPRSHQDLERALRSVAEEVDRLARVAEDLLVLARVDEGRLPLRSAPIPPTELLHTVAQRFASRAARAGRALEVATHGEGPIVGDRLRVEQALGNLVDNALRHGSGTVRLEAERQDGVVVFRVSDEGAGFPPDFLPRAFERFTRADEARGDGAAGLGLPIVESIARAHGGTAGAENRAGNGPVVSLTLPAAGEP